MAEVDDNLRRATGGDQAALQELVVANLSKLEVFVRKRTGDRFLGREPLEDIVQSAAREALAHLSGHDYQGAAAFEAWLYRIALTKIIARHRHYHAARRDLRREEAVDPAVSLADVCAHFSTPSQSAMGAELQSRLSAALAQLSPDHQQVFFLGRILELPHAEIARQMGRSEQASRKLLIRAIAHLGAVLGTDTPPRST